MRLFKGRIHQQRAKACARGRQEAEKFLRQQNVTAADIQNLERELKETFAGYQELLVKARQSLKEYDETIQEARAGGKDISEKVKIRHELAQSIIVMEKALAEITSAFFPTPPQPGETFS